MEDGVSLMGLGMDESAMLDLTNRLNCYDSRKWTLTVKRRPKPILDYSTGQAANLAIPADYTVHG